MSDMILITGASGKLGQKTIAELLDRGIPAQQIIATTRTPEKLGALASQGVHVRAADFDNPASLPEAFAGATKLALISTDALDQPGKRLTQHLAAVTAAQAAGVKHIFYTSMPNPIETSPIPFAPDHSGTEKAIKDSSMAYTILRNGWYQENLFASLPQALAIGRLYTSAGDGKCAYVSHDDCAASLAGALMSKDVAGETFTLTGPKAITMAELGDMTAKATDKNLSVFNITDAQLSEGMKAFGVPDVFVDLLVAFDANTRAGHVDMVTDAVEKLSGRAPKDLSEFLTENAVALATAPAPAQS